MILLNVPISVKYPIFIYILGCPSFIDGHYLCMVCVLSGPTETILMGTCSSFSKKSIYSCKVAGRSLAESICVRSFCHPFMVA